MSEDSSNGQGCSVVSGRTGRRSTDRRFVRSEERSRTREDLAQNAREGSEYLRARGRQAAERAGQMVDKGKEQVNQYVGKGREVVDRGRAQWEDFVERGKNLVNDQTGRMECRVDAGREAYQSTAKPSEPTA